MMAVPSLLSVVTVFVFVCMNDGRAAVIYDQMRSAPPVTDSSPGSELSLVSVDTCCVFVFMSLLLVFVF